MSFTPEHLRPVEDAIMALPVGRELDERVAREVMGQVPCDSWVYFNMGAAGGPAMMKVSKNDSYARSLPGGQDVSPCPHPDGACYPARASWGPGQYSKLMQVAWLAVERMVELGYTPEIDHREAGWAVQFTKYNLDMAPEVVLTHKMYRHVVIDPDIKLAICRCALLTVTMPLVP